MFVFGFCMKNKMYCCSYHPTSDHYIKTQLSLLSIQNFFGCLLFLCNIAQYLWVFLFVYIISYTHCTLCFIKNIVSKYCSLFCVSNSSVILLIESRLHFHKKAKLNFALTASFDILHVIVWVSSSKRFYQKSSKCNFLDHSCTKIFNYYPSKDATLKQILFSRHFNTE